MDTNFFAMCAIPLLTVSAAVPAANVTLCAQDACLYNSGNRLLHACFGRSFAIGALLSRKFLEFFVRGVAPIRENGVHRRARGCYHVCVECEEFVFASWDLISTHVMIATNTEPVSRG